MVSKLYQTSEGVQMCGQHDPPMITLQTDSRYCSRHGLTWSELIFDDNGGENTFVYSFDHLMSIFV